MVAMFAYMSAVRLTEHCESAYVYVLRIVVVIPNACTEHTQRKERERECLKKKLFEEVPSRMCAYERWHISEDEEKIAF